MTLTRNSFRPTDFDSRNSEGPRRVHFTDFKDQIVNKGGSELLKIDVAKLDTMLADLRAHQQVAIRDLSLPQYKELSEEFKQMVSYVNILYDSNSYQSLHTLVKKHFGDLSQVNPGTIGAYFAGCHLDTSFSNEDPANASCSIICAGSMPKPKDEDNWSFCKQTVIWAVYNGNTFSFTTLNRAADKENALVFVNYPSNDAFIGFSEAEKNNLSRMGVKKVQLYGYQEGSNEYTAFNSNGFADVKDLKSRVQIVPTATSTTTTTGTTTNGVLILFLVLVLLLILFFAWKVSSD